ncbi:putative ankyrin repeat protein RF_0381 [Patella vulgata]|uniref:putative ankyrin repeat protein RF_0381 n=1 Tax=Patella vulgata TaxID=6465 RepID=UPI0024A96E39|nr:putative ankyrin repeat protein RF_0381 [Patella vulgata]
MSKGDTRHFPQSLVTMALSFRDFRDRIEVVVSKNDLKAVEDIINNPISLNDYESQCYYYCRVNHCVEALKKKDIALLKLLLPLRYIIIDGKLDELISIKLISTAIKSDFAEGVEFLHSQGLILEVGKPVTKCCSTYYNYNKMHESWSALVESVEDGSCNVLRYCLSVPNLDKDPDPDLTLIMRACQGDNIRVLNILLDSELKQTVNRQTSMTYHTALHMCIQGEATTDKQAFIKALVEAGAHVNAPSVNPSLIPMFMAVEAGLTKSLIFLVENGADINVTDKEGNGVLHYLAENLNNTDHIEQCVDIFKDHIDDRNQQQETPLHLAARKGNLLMTKSLISLKCDINKRGGNELRSPLLVALMESECEIAKTLILAGSDVGLADKDGVTPIMKSCTLRHVGLFKLLVEHGADINATDNNGNAIFEHCFSESAIPRVESSCAEFLDVLLSIKRNILLNPSVIIKAIKMQDVRALKLLLLHCCDINKISENGETLLIVACGVDDVHVVQLLIQSGCDVNGTNSHGETALHKAAAIQRLFGAEKISEVIKLLLQHGADVNVRDNNGKAVIMLVTETGNTDLFHAFLKEGADVNSQDNEGKTALMIALEKNRDALSRALIENMANVNLFDKSGRTALMIAAEKNNKSLIEELITAGADVNSVDNNGRSALHYIAIKGTNRSWINCFKLLLMHGSNASLDVPRQNGEKILYNLLAVDEVDLNWFMLIENCSLKVLPVRSSNSYLQYHTEPLNLAKILYQSGCNAVIAGFTLILDPNGGKELSNQFSLFRRDMSLKSICRRQIRLCIGAGLGFKLSLTSLSCPLKEFVLMKDVIDEGYFKLKLKESDDKSLTFSNFLSDFNFNKPLNLDNPFAFKFK